MIKNLKTIQNFPSTPDDEIEEIRAAIAEIAKDIEQELDLNQDKVYFTYTRPEQVTALQTPFGKISTQLAESLFTKEEKENGLVEEFIKEHTVYSIVPKTIVTKLTSTESIRVLNLLFTIFKEKLEKKLEEKDR